MVESMRSIMNLAVARIGLHVNALRDGRTDIMPLLLRAVGEVHSIADEIQDFHVSRVAQLLRTYLTRASGPETVRPDVIQTHLNAIDVLFKTPNLQTRMRDQVVGGLEEVIAKVGAG